MVFRSFPPLVETVEGILQGILRAQVRGEPSHFIAFNQLPKLVQSLKIVENNSVVFITSKGLRTSLHSDVDHSMLLHVGGRKRVVVIHPDDSDRNEKKLKHLLTYRGKSGSIQSLYIDSNDMVIKSTPMMIDYIQPGDLLYIPKRYRDIDTYIYIVPSVYIFHVAHMQCR